jgi:hypothetical protein
VADALGREEDEKRISHGEKYIEKVIQYAIPLRPLFDDDLDPLINAAFHANDFRCLVPACNGLLFCDHQKEALWDKFFTAAPRPRTRFEQQYSDRKLDMPELKRDDYACEDTEDLRYGEYIRQHPEFAKIARRPDMRKRWRRALITYELANGVDGLNICIYQSISRRYYTSVMVDRFFYLPECPALIDRMLPDEREGYDAIAELLDYALLGSGYARDMVLDDLEPHSVQMFPELHFYFQQWLDNIVPPTGNWREVIQELLEPDAGEKLSPERRAQVLDALSRNDYQAVLAMQPDPCIAPRPEGEKI